MKRTIKATPTRPISVEKLKDREISEEFQLQVSNRFEILEQIRNIEDEWQKFTNEMKECEEAVIGCRRGTSREHWISKATWRLVNRRRETKQKRNQAKTEDEQRKEDAAYRALDTAVKKNCRRDKKT